MREERDCILPLIRKAFRARPLRDRTSGSIKDGEYIDSDNEMSRSTRERRFYI